MASSVSRLSDGAQRRVGTLRHLICLCCLCLSMACRGTPRPLVAQVDGQFKVSGLSAPVRVVRDRWGVPHVHAQSRDDLFIAQGFVQAQDRLFQMDLWRRSVQGRLAEVLGGNFVKRDAMTRRVQYRGDLAAEWASYGPETKAIATAFVSGINAWVAVARERPPEEFLLAGWRPEFWSAADLLNRTDAFLAGRDAIDEVGRRGLSPVLADAIRPIGTAPFFIGLEARVPASGGDSAPDPVSKEVEAARQQPRAGSDATASREALVFGENGGTFSAPSGRYFVHLQAPDWNVIGATRPWLPGVASGHNGHVGWAMAPYSADTQDIVVEPIDAPEQIRVTDTLSVFGRAEPVEFESILSPRGLVVTTDREAGNAYVLRWTGTEPGTAAELAALALNRVRNWPDFRAALARWKNPLARFVYVDAAGNVGSQTAGLVPNRRGEDWAGWMTLDDLPNSFNPPSGSVAAAPDRTGLAAGSDALFAHVLGITPSARRRFNVGPVARPAGDDAAVRFRLDSSAWDRSRAVNAPGQSESPSSVHAADLAALWSKGEMFPLAFSDAEVQANAAATLTLIP